MVSRRGFRLGQTPWVRRHGERCAPARVRDHGTRYPHHARNHRRIINLLGSNGRNPRFYSLSNVGFVNRALGLHSLPPYR
jgi:hypothetical protein